MTTLVSYNVNGIRAALNKNLLEWIAKVNPDIIGFNELKADPSQFDVTQFENLGYYAHWFPAQKKGYSGVAILSKEKPQNVTLGCGIEKFDFEGRMIQCDFKNFSVICNYFPSGSSGEERQELKFEYLDSMMPIFERIKSKKKNLVIMGDFNICHKEIDIHNPKSNAQTSGFLPEERAWMSSFFQSGFTDSFRKIHPDKAHAYSWWSFRAGARAKNLGWRIDYQAVSESLSKNIVDAQLFPDALHSDHCPTFLQLDI